MTEVVGRNVGNKKPTEKPNLFFPTAGTGAPKKSSVLLDTINAKLASSNPNFKFTEVENIEVNDFMATLSNSQKNSLATLLRKAGFTIRTLEDVDIAIDDSFSNLDTSSFNKFYKAVANQIVPKESEDKDYRPRIDVYMVPDEELEADIDEVSLSVAGKILSAEEKALYLPISKALMAKGTRTTQKITPKGELLTTQTPGFTREMGKEAVTEAILKSPELAADVERKKTVDFYKWVTQR